MGINTHYYTVHGIHLNEFPEDFWEAYDEVYDDEDTPFVIVDGYSGNYMILGTPLFDSGDLRFNEIEDVFVEIDLDALPQYEKAYREKFTTKFPQFSHLLDEPFKLMTLVHYS